MKQKVITVETYDYNKLQTMINDEMSDNKLFELQNIKFNTIYLEDESTILYTAILIFRKWK